MVFKIEIEKEVEDRINWFTHNYKEEISGWLVGEMTPDLISVKEIIFPYQEVGGASVDTTPQALIKLRKEYGDKCLKIIGHWHSHNTMKSFWSSIDDTFINEYMQQREKGLFIVSSKTDGSRVRLELRKPINISLDELDYKVVTDEEDVLGNELREMIELKVTKAATPIITVGKNSGWGTYNRNNGYSAYGNINIQAGDELLGQDSSYNNSCKNDDIDRRIEYNKKKRVVGVIGLTLSQTVELEDLGKYETSQCDGGFDMFFNVTGKKEAKRIIREVKEYLKTKEEETAYNAGYDGGY